MKQLLAQSRIRGLMVLGAALILPNLLAQTAAAQDVAITNARIIVRGGKIVSAAAGTANTQGLKVIDAKGMSAMPGFIDGHRHVNTGPNEKQQMQALLEAGYTTILSGGGPAEGNLVLRDHIEKGMINGPRIIPSGSVRLNITEAEARAAIRKMADQGIKFTGEINVTPRPGPTAQEIELLKAIVDESKKVGVMVQVHAVSPPAMLAAAEAGVPLLVHTPHFGWQSMEDSKKIAALGVKQLSTIGFGAPVFGVFAEDNKPRFRDGGPWPDKIIDGEGRGQEAGYKPVNARTSWDAGIVYGYGTDTNYDPKAGLEHELHSLRLMFSIADIIKMMGPNSAAYIQMADQLGTIESGKLADIILLDGNPFDGYWNMLNTKVVLKGGNVVVDKR
jgi:imidazolonepropionase-like amidohydrolase